MDLKPKKILIVKLNQLGDTVRFLPTIEAIRNGLPEDHLTFLTTNIGKEIVEGSKLVDEIWVSAIDEVKSLYGFLRWLRVIRKSRFDIDIASSDSSSSISLLFFLSSIPVRVGFTNPKLSFLFNTKILFSKDITHTALNLRIIEQLGLSTKHTKPKIDISEGDKRDILHMLSKYGISDSEQFIVLHIGSNRPSHRWPIDRFAKVINLLLKKYSIKIVCIGGKRERRFVSSLQTLVNNDCIIDATNKTNIKELIYLISLATLFIGHSSGPLHIAYMVGTPTVSLWGASSLAVWGPEWDKEKHICIQTDLNCVGCEQNICPKGTLECMKSINVDMVIKKISKLIEKYAVKISK